MSKKVKNVFISHIHEDDEELGDLKDLLSKRGMEVRDSSITADKPNRAKSDEYIKYEILGPHIEWASVLIVYISPETEDSKWVNWEIEYAREKDKIIVGVYEQGALDCEIPEALDGHGDALVGWNAKKIIDAINGDYTQFENPDGSPRKRRTIPRHRCE